jgi:hypothetical protein
MSLKINWLCGFFMVFAIAFSACKNDQKGMSKPSASSDPNSEIEIPLLPDGTPDTMKLAKILFEEPTFQFDTIVQGDVVKHSFKFKNVGHVPLIIKDAKSSCGCTVPEFSKEPVAVGESGEIIAKFNTANRQGQQGKIVQVFANIPYGPAKVTIKGYVMSKDEKTIADQKKQ